MSRDTGILVVEQAGTPTGPWVSFLEAQGYKIAVAAPNDVAERLTGSPPDLVMLGESLAGAGTLCVKVVWLPQGCAAFCGASLGRIAGLT